LHFRAGSQPLATDLTILEVQNHEMILINPDEEFAVVLMDQKESRDHWSCGWCENDSGQTLAGSQHSKFASDICSGLLNSECGIVLLNGGLLRNLCASGLVYPSGRKAAWDQIVFVSSESSRIASLEISDENDKLTYGPTSRKFTFRSDTKL
jgi:hypothetical protein